MSAKISVVMAVYNGRRYLLEQVHSVLAQFEDGDELIAIDDGSTDGSGDLLRELNAPGLRVVTNAVNLGIKGSFQRGLCLARNPYVFLSDQDDIWLPGKRAAYVAEFEKNPQVSVVLSNAQVIDGAGQLVQASYMDLRGGFQSGVWATLLKNRYLGCVMALRRSLLDVALPIPRRAPMHDMWLGVMGAIHGKVKYLPQPYLQYRRHGGNATPLRSVASVYQMLVWRMNMVAALGGRMLDRAFGTRTGCASARGRLTLVEQYFYPDGWGGAEIPRDISIALQRSGFDVEVLCGAEQYAPHSGGDPDQDPTRFGVSIRRIPKVVPGSVRRARMLRLLWFCACALPLLLVRRRVDVIATQTNPPLVVPIVALAAALRRIPFIIIAQDVYPDVLFASGVAKSDSVMGRTLQRLFSWAYKRARRVVTLGSFMQRRIGAKGVDLSRMVTISNWATGDVRPVVGPDNPLRDRWDLRHRFVVLYSGNLGVGHEFATFLGGVRLAAASDARISVVFIGSGSRLDEVRDLTRKLGLQERVSFRDFVPAGELPLTMGLADLALVTLRPGFEGVIVPSKLLGYMARSVPILYVGPDSDAAEMIREADCGTSCLTDQAERVAEALLQAASEPELLARWSRNGRQYYEAHFARERALARYVDLLSSVAASK